MRTRLGCIVAFMVLSVGLALAAEKQIIRRPGTKTGGNYSPGILASFTIGVLCAPVALADQTAAPPVAIRDVAGSTFALAARGDGSVVAWGRGAPGGALAAPTPIALPGPAQRVAVGESSAYALLEDGSVVAWGENDEGQLGNGPSGSNKPLGAYPKPSATPVRVTDLAGIIAIAAGRKHAIALGKDGTVWAWGVRDDGAVGDGDAKPAGSLRVVSAAAPVKVRGLAGITQIAAGPTHNLALTGDGKVMSWGSNSTGELGVGTRDTGWTPAEVTGLTNVVAIAAGSGQGTYGVSAAVRQDGTLWVWGSGSSAMMGNGVRNPSPDDAGGRNLLPLQVKGIAGAKAAAVGAGHIAAVLNDGSVRAWGMNGYGEVGLGANSAYEVVPVKVSGLTNVATLRLGGYSSYAIRSDGTLWIWGFGLSPGRGILSRNIAAPTRLDLP
jgi:alpha-tubulin suppressor-like RCC1 family protein